MDIKMMHEMIEKLTECAKYELDKGVEAVDTKEMGEVTDIIKDLAEAMYYRTLVEAMKESEYGEEYDEYGPMDDGRRGYRGQPRDSRGRFRSRRGRRSYEEPWNEVFDYNEMERMRDMDRTHGRLYYTDGTSGTSGMTSGSTSGNIGGSNMGSTGGNRGYSESGEGGQYSSRMQRDSREGRSGKMRRGYMEAKEMGKDKGEKMKELEEYMKELSTDVTEMIEGASPEEKTLLKTKMQTLLTKIQ